MFFLFDNDFAIIYLLAVFGKGENVGTGMESACAYGNAGGIGSDGALFHRATGNVGYREGAHGIVGRCLELDDVLPYSRSLK